MNKPLVDLTAKDFATDQEVRWCPGCGDYAILKCMQRTLPELGATPANTVFVSGIGCSSRFPYYMATYGFHTIHGRAPAVATGVKLANPDLDVWMITGDGDGLSIGGNHLMHVLRRNVDLNILLFNNEIYGLTKGQYSPTSREGTRSPSTPYGSLDRPISPAGFALGSGARFVARTIDTAQKHMPDIFKRAHGHKGASFVEIFQNCIVYNDGVFNEFTEKAVFADQTLDVVHGQPMIFGKDRNKGLMFDAKNFRLAVANIGEDGVDESDILIHDETNPTLATMLAGLHPPDFPMVIGVIFCSPASSFDRDMTSQMNAVKAERGAADMNAYLRRGYSWTVE
ncbi:2-oxoglutarate ferredoxin oxidoreductase subunit beta [Iodidimonas nitroreducens]|uniref:2-oxoglutarate ferredoxin oxidoreductase subunit beta n=1 Tax=Iodidimonas nitroreducens TaxID=1236968 RepID=A0A5A7N702_9PROT|nr:2-oxoacid:ferredoxin oxidoreductase subunit beta [Iodidimonas nitroreducens]GAK33309.1 2-oxoglutarate oxidoreductase subunit KorB [alpha proteobacterium Q-1]GER04102.1 2-oxoglutarate ferredoxin oxidoreductase subunit beta [Iodidimonas nitroreducens]